jgi:hypothetical protein
LNLSYRKYIWKNKTTNQSYIVAKNATGHATVLEDISDNLIEWGFNLNDYNQCIANKSINSKQCTIIWHVDNLKKSHEDKGSRRYHKAIKCNVQQRKSAHHHMLKYLNTLA